MSGGVCLRVREQGLDILVLYFASPREAAPTRRRLGALFPEASFVLEHTLH